MKTALAALLMLAAAGAARAQEVRVYNWNDYIDPKVIEQFTKETGIKVVYDTYDSNEVLETKLLAGKTGYDIVAPSATFLQRQIKAGVFQPIDRSKLSNAKGLWPEVDRQLARYDAGNRHAINYMWFTTGVGYNVAKARERLGDRPLDSWDLVLKPENLKKFADCGVYVLDSPEDLFAIALNWLKLNPDSKRAEDIRRAAQELGKLRSSIKKFHSSEYINALASGDICLAIGWAGDVFQARNRAKEARNNVEIAYAIP
jgi:putrescine transport system substrate-binding protein